MKILHIITGLDLGGAETMLLNLVRHLRSDMDFSVISLSDRMALAPEFNALGVDVYSLSMASGKMSVSALAKLMRLIREIRPDAVHTWMYHADLIGGVAARLCGIRAISWGVHNSNLDADKTKASTILVARLCALLSWIVPKRILSCSQRAMSFHVARGYDARKFEVIPNGFDLQKFRPVPDARASVRREFGLAENALLVGLIGRFDPQKNHEGFLKMAAVLVKKVPDVHFVLAGKDVDVSNSVLLEWAERSGVVEFCHFLGIRHDVPRVMSALDFYVSCSFGEAFPNVIGEAMACGVPCVVTDVGDCAYIAGDTGRVVESVDALALAEAVMSLIDLGVSKRAEMGLNARNRIQSLFDISVVANSYREFYELLSEQSSSDGR